MLRYDKGAVQFAGAMLYRVYSILAKITKLLYSLLYSLASCNKL